MGFGGCETRPMPHRTLHIGDRTATTTHHVMMIVANAIFVAGQRANWLDTANDALLHERAQGVVHRLTRNAADAGMRCRRHFVGSGVRCLVNGSQYCDSLGSHRHAVSSKSCCRVKLHVQHASDFFGLNLNFDRVRTNVTLRGFRSLWRRPRARHDGQPPGDRRNWVSLPLVCASPLIRAPEKVDEPRRHRAGCAAEGSKLLVTNSGPHLLEGTWGNCIFAQVAQRGKRSACWRVGHRQLTLRHVPKRNHRPVDFHVSASTTRSIHRTKRHLRGEPQRVRGDCTVRSDDLACGLSNRPHDRLSVRRHNANQSGLPGSHKDAPTNPQDHSFTNQSTHCLVDRRARTEFEQSSRREWLTTRLVENYTTHCLSYASYRSRSKCFRRDVRKCTSFSDRLRARRGVSRCRGGG